MPKNVHDSFFKASFSHIKHAVSLLSDLLPTDLVAQMDFSTLVLCPTSFVDEALCNRHSDLLFTVMLRGHQAYVYLLFEHQSTEDPLMPFRILVYLVRIWETHLRTQKEEDPERVPVIVPLVLHHSETGWRVATSFAEILEIEPEMLEVVAPYVPQFRFILDDISLVADDALKARLVTAFDKVVLWCLKHARRSTYIEQHLPVWAKPLLQVLRPTEFRLVFRYLFEIMTRAGHDQKKVVELLGQTIEGGFVMREEDVVSLADELRFEGWMQCARSMLLKMLRARFGRLPSVTVDQVQGANTQQIEGWVEKVLTASTLADVFATG